MQPDLLALLVVPIPVNPQMAGQWLTAKETSIRSSKEARVHGVNHFQGGDGHGVKLRFEDVPVVCLGLHPSRWTGRH
jgi:hypothetical protein